MSLGNNSRICSAHFRPTDVSGRVRKTIKKNAVPSIFAWNQQNEIIEELVSEPSKVQETFAWNQQNEIIEELVSEPSKVQKTFAWNQQQDEIYEKLVFDPSKVQTTYSRPPPITFVEAYPFLDVQTEEDDPLEVSGQEVDYQQAEMVGNYIISNQAENEESVQDNSEDLPQLFTYLHNEIDDNVIEIDSGKSVQTQTNVDNSQQNQGISKETQTLGNGFSINDYKNDDRSLHFFTGLECFEKFMLVFHSLGTSVYELDYFYGPPPEKIDILEQFFITLIILRRHKTFEEITMLYKISLKHVYTIFVTWIRFMSIQWKTLDLWVDRDYVRAYMPFDFHEKYPATRVIIDATECPIKKPKLPLAQQVTFSTYKNRNTIKFLVGITPGGLISYISHSWGGYATDRHIIETSPILQKFNYNDEIMVDKGLDVQDIFLPYGVKVNMPAFFKKGNQIESATLNANRKVASKRVHIERVIGMLKTFKILTQPMNQTEILLSSDIVFVVSQLVNFRLNIINKNA